MAMVSTTTSAGVLTLDSLPAELKAMVLDYLDLASLLAVDGINKQWRRFSDYLFQKLPPNAFRGAILEFPPLARKSLIVRSRDNSYHINLAIAIALRRLYKTGRMTDGDRAYIEAKECLAELGELLKVKKIHEIVKGETGIALVPGPELSFAFETASNLGEIGIIELMLDLQHQWSSEVVGRSIIHAAEHGYLSIVELFLGHFEISGDTLREALIKSACNNQRQVVTKLLEYKDRFPERAISTAYYGVVNLHTPSVHREILNLLRPHFPENECTII